MTIDAIRPCSFPYFPYEGFTFCLGRSDGTSAWLSGHSGAIWDECQQKMAVAGPMGAQASMMYEKIGAILEGVGLSFADVVHVTENVTLAGVDSYEEAEEVRRTVLADTPYALSTVIVDRLVRRAALIEVEVMAHRGGGEPFTVGTSSGWFRSRGVLTGETVHLPTVLPVDEHGAVVAEGDFAGQYRHCLQRADALLHAVDLSLADVVRTVDYSTPATRSVYRESDRPRRDLLRPPYPASAGILMSRLHHPGVLVALDVTASRDARRAVNPGWGRYDTLTYSPAVQAGSNVFMSGFAALDMDSQRPLFPGDLEAQAGHIYHTVVGLLRYLGAGPEDLIETIEYVTPAGLPDYRAVAKVRQQLLAPPWPASVGAVCGGLLRPEFMLEVLPFAVLPP